MNALELYDRDGKPISMDEWSELISNPEYKIVQQNTLSNGRWVSTVWLGNNHAWGDGPPLIFETMVFPSRGDFAEMYCERYATEEAAKTGHQIAMALALDDTWTGYSADD